MRSASAAAPWMTKDGPHVDLMDLPPLASDPPGQRSGLSLGELFAIGAALTFSLKGILVKLGLAEGVDASALLAVRMTLASPFFLILLIREGGMPMGWRDLLTVVLFGVVGFYGASILDFQGLQYIGAGLERIVVYVHPTLVLLFAAAWSGRRLSLAQLGAVLLAWSGLVLAAAGDLSVGAGGDLLTGVLLVLGCAVLYAAYLVGLEAVGPRLGVLRVAAAANLVSAIAIDLHVGLLKPEALASITARGWWIGLTLAVAGTVLPAMLLAAAITRIGPARTSALGMVGPVSAAVLAWICLGEPLGPAQIGGGIIVAVGVALSRRVA